MFAVETSNALNWTRLIFFQDGKPLNSPLEVTFSMYQVKFAFFVLASCVTALTLRAESVAATVSAVKGDAYASSCLGKLIPQEMVPAGSLLRTAQDSTLQLRLLPGVTAVVSANTDIRMSRLDYSQTFEDLKRRRVGLDLKQGAVGCAVDDSDEGTQVRLVTPVGAVLMDETAQAVVSYSARAGLLIDAVAGDIQVSLIGGKILTIPAGKMLDSPDGVTSQVSVAPAPTTGPGHVDASSRTPGHNVTA
jgi:hypothetical protein